MMKNYQSSGLRSRTLWRWREKKGGGGGVSMSYAIFMCAARSSGTERVRERAVPQEELRRAVSELRPLLRCTRIY